MRHQHGADSQERVLLGLSKLARDRRLPMTVNSVAGIGQRGVDLDISVGGARVHVEVKRIRTKSQPIVIYSATAKRGNKNEKLDAAISAMAPDTDVGGAKLSRLMAAIGKPLNLTEVVDFYRKNVDSTVGMAGDGGKTPVTGKMPRVGSSKRDAVDRVMKLLRRGGKNEYLAVHVASDDDVYLFCLGGDDVFLAGKMPVPSRVFLDTYGRDYRGSTRVAIRAVLSPESYK